MYVGIQLGWDWEILAIKTDTKHLARVQYVEKFMAVPQYILD